MKLELDEKTYEQITQLCSEGDSAMQQNDLNQAYQHYKKAWDMLPEPQHEWEAATWIMTALGDVYFYSKDFAHVISTLEYALACPGGLGNPYIHLRLGQAYYEVNDLDKAADHLTRCYMGSELDLLGEEDEKYLNFLKSKIILN
ncbi:tetratricopeptide repeat protein [Aliikangiella maris]|uniref:Tetratricopeptide repeat protein n=2 Tax=Aliikangiella maris TaxID=3162458 RepID=A0ABV3MKM3_9GAMM